MGKSFTPIQRNWMWWDDDAAEPTSYLATENNEPTLADNVSIIRLRLAIEETGDVTSANTLTVEYDTNSGFTGPTALGASNHFDYANGQATEGNTTTTYKLTGPTTHDLYYESGVISCNIAKSTYIELDVAIVPTSNVSASTRYYFRALLGGTAVPINGGTSPSLVTAAGGTDYKQYPADNEGVTDAAVRSMDAARTAGDDEGVTDDAQRAMTLNRVIHS